MAAQPIFIDTAYVLALFNTRDQWHPAAIEWQQRIAQRETPLLTTEFVLTEIGDSLSSLRLRSNGAKVIRALRESPSVTLISASPDLFERALVLFEDRNDKEWGLTDCTSFVFMQENGLTDALTTDEHFRQAGFTPLLLN